MRVKVLKKTLIIVFSILVIFIGGIFLYTYSLFDKMGNKKFNSIKTVELNNAELNNAESNKESEDEIVNIALFGVDSRNEKYEALHSDSIIILSLDKKHQKIKLSSIMRDSRVDVEGRGKDKINEAYAFGGPSLAIKTLNNNFDLKIKDYVTVDFFGLEDIINCLGGVNIDIKEKEIKEINKCILEVSTIKKSKATYITKKGLQRLNGRQAVAYARVRNVGNGDFDRTQRQSILIKTMIDKLKEVEVIKYPELLSKISEYVETSLTPMDMLKVGKTALKLNPSQAEWMRFPLDGKSKGEMIKGKWFLTYDVPSASYDIKSFIYYDINPNSKEETVNSGKK